MQIITLNVDETVELGRIMGELAPPNTCIALHGNLGAGKTQLARGIAVGAAVEDVSLVSSPTYVLLNIYNGIKPVFHLDAYRVESEEDFAAVGFEELLTSNGIVVVEWAEKILPLLPADRVDVFMEVGAVESERIVRLEGAKELLAPIGKRWAEHRAQSRITKHE